MSNIAQIMKTEGAVEKRPTPLLGHQNGAEVNLALLQLVHGLDDTGLGHREDLEHRPDLVEGGELEHALLDVPRGDDGPLDGDGDRDEGQVGDREVAAVDGQRVDGGAGCQDRHELGPVGLARGGDQQAVERVRHLELGLAFGRDELVGTEPHGLLLLRLGARDHDDAAAHLGRELDGQVAEAADAHDADGLGGQRAVRVERVEHGGAAAHQGRGVRVRYRVGDLEQERLPPDGVGREAALVAVRVYI